MKVAPTSFSFYFMVKGDVMAKAIDMIGVKEKNWVVIERGEPPKKNLSNSVYWKCQCQICGAIKTFNGAEIRRQRIGDCKHPQNTKTYPKIPKTAIKDETGNRYNNLVVISFAYTKNGLAYWNCLCDCGNTIIVRGNHLRTGAVKSCGCLISYKEKCIENILKEYNIQYEQQYIFSDLKDKKSLRFDFALFKHNTLIGLIEYNGMQHYEEPNTFNQFGLLQQHDKMKMEYCERNNLPLLVLTKEDDLLQIITWYNNL